MEVLRKDQKEVLEISSKNTNKNEVMPLMDILPDWTQMRKISELGDISGDTYKDEVKKLKSPNTVARTAGGCKQDRQHAAGCQERKRGWKTHLLW